MFGNGNLGFAHDARTPGIPTDGKFRSGNAIIAEQHGTYYYLDLSLGTKLHRGDSGGPSFAVLPNARILTGVHSQCSFPSVRGREGPDPLGTWIADTGSCADAPLYSVTGNPQFREFMDEATRIPIPRVVIGTHEVDPFETNVPRNPSTRVAVPTPSVPIESHVPTNRPPMIPGTVPAPTVDPKVANPATCKTGFVWRAASPTDLVCVTAASRDLVAQENSTAAQRSLPGGHCQSGYVWREAFDGDGVCVTPQRREAVRAENQLGPSLRVSTGGNLGPGRINRNVFPR